MNAIRSLRQILVDAKKRTGFTMEELSVLAADNDPYRQDTPAGHRDGQWLADQIERLQIPRPIHLRGLHYRLVAAGGVIRPNGEAYVNDDPTWTWLSNDADKAARWLGYVAWEDIKDERNEAPSLHFAEPRRAPEVGAWFDIDVTIPDDVKPTVWVGEFVARQQHQLYLIGEKSSLSDTLAPLAKRYGATLALPTGEISATMIYTMAEHMESDGRAAVVFYFSDADPSGWQMPISAARKFQALRDLQFPALDVQVRRVALTPDQAKVHGLPSTPLKASERRADRWKEAFGVEQTEIDALAALRPDLLRSMAVEAIEPFYDKTLLRRCNEARTEYREMAQIAFAERADPDMIASLRKRAETGLAEFREKIDALREEMRAVEDIDLGLPPPYIPEANPTGHPSDAPIYWSGWDWADATRELVRQKAYTDE